MRNFSYDGKWQKLLTPAIVKLLTCIHEYKGAQVILSETKAEVLNMLAEVARIQSTEASNRIEGILVSDERLKKLVMDKTTPVTLSEQEIAGYRDVLATIQESYEYIPFKPNIILQLHAELYKFSGQGVGGRYKNADNVVSQENENINNHISFAPVAACKTPIAMDELCKAYSDAVEVGGIDPLLAIPMCVLDFLCIHPFGDGNGRMSRLITLLLLYRAGYFVGKFISIEKLIEDSEQTYYEALNSSSNGWLEGCNDYAPFVRYTLGIVAAAYRKLNEHICDISRENLSKPDRVRKIIKSNYGKITKSEIMQRFRDISQVTVQRALNELIKNGDIIKIGGGRYTSYVWNRDKEQKEQTNDNR